MTMEVMRSSSSALNPNAAPFVPQAYRSVEDFSEDWWALVQSSPWFCDYWMNECFHEPSTLYECEDEFDYADSDLDECFASQDEEEKKWCGKSRAESPRFMEKASKIVNVKVSPRPIQQPR